MRGFKPSVCAGSVSLPTLFSSELRRVSLNPWAIGLVLSLWLLHGTASADTYTLTGSQGSGLSWNSVGSWSDSGSSNPVLDGNGNLPASSYVVPVFDTLRTPTTGNPTFGGSNATTLTLGYGSTLLIKTAANSTVTVPVLTSNGGAGAHIVNLSPNGAAGLFNFVANSLTNNGTLELSTGSTPTVSQGLTFTAATITGVGNLLLDGGTAGVGSIGLTLGGASGNAQSYTGAVTFTTNAVTLNLLNAFTSGGSLIITSTASVNLDGNDVTFAGLTINGTVYGPGTYSYSQLYASYPSTFSPTQSSSGEITVVPEPGEMGSFLMCIALSAYRGGRKRGHH